MIKILFIRNEFKLSDTGTWLAVPIRAALNHDNPKDERIRYNHLAIEINGIIYEAGWNKKKKRAEVFKRTRHEWLASRKHGSWKEFVIDKRNISLQQIEQAEKFLVDQLGKKYDYYDVCFAQLIRQMAGKRVWIGTDRYEGNKMKWYCSNLIAYVLVFYLEFELNCSVFEADPEDVYNLFANER